MLGFCRVWGISCGWALASLGIRVSSWISYQKQTAQFPIKPRARVWLECKPKLNWKQKTSKLVQNNKSAKLRKTKQNSFEGRIISKNSCERPSETKRRTTESLAIKKAFRSGRISCVCCAKKCLKNRRAKIDSVDEKMLENFQSEVKREKSSNLWSFFVRRLEFLQSPDPLFIFWIHDLISAAHINIDLVSTLSKRVWVKFYFVSFRNVVSIKKYVRIVTLYF